MDPKVDIFVLRYRGAPLDAQDAINGMANWTAASGIDIRMPALRGNALIHRARNIALKRLRPDATHVLFCDDDMAPEKDALLRLLKRGVPVVAALCTTKEEFPPIIAAKAYDAAEDRFAMIESIKPDAFLTGKFGVGAAFLLVETWVIEALKEHYLSGADWLDDNRRTFDRMHVRSENREKERSRIENVRRELYKKEQLIRIFQHSVQDNQLDRGEDIHLSRNLIALNIPISIDASVQVLHVGYFGYGPHLLGINDVKELRMTA